MGKNSRFSKLFFLLITAFYSIHALADHAALPDVVVEGADLGITLSLPSMEEARERLNLTPGGVDLIDAEQYKLGRTSTLRDALGWSPGVFVQPRFGAEEARLSIRGSGLQRTFHLRGIKLLQDGVPINQADGGGDFQSIEPLALRYIEVYRGANALTYGSSTLGGAINFVSPSGYDAPLFQARGEFGSFGYIRGQASSGGAHGNLDYFLSLSHFSQDGFRDHSLQDNQRLFGNAGYRLTPDIETRFFLTLLDTKSQLPGNLTKAQLNDDPSQANATSVARDARRDFPLARIANRTTFQRDNWRVDLSLYYTYKDLFHPIAPFRIEQRTDDFGADLRLTHDGELFGRRNIFTFGFNPAVGYGNDQRFDCTFFGCTPGALFAHNRLTATNLDFYAENQFYILDDLALVLGAQVTHGQRRLDDRLNPGAGGNSFNETYIGFNPKIGLRYDINEHAQIFTNVSRSFEPPSFGELSGAQLVNVLDAQRATTFEIGTRGNTGNMHWDLAYYRAWIKNEFLALNDALGNPLGTISADRTIHQGIEAGLYIDLFERLELRQTYLWNDFRFRNDPVYGNNRLAGVPAHVYRAELVYHTPQGFYIGPNVEWSPSDAPVDHANTLFADGYAILGLKAGYRRPDGLSVFVEGRNLTNKKYAATTGVIADAGGMDSAQFLPGDGASVYAGFEWRY